MQEEREAQGLVEVVHAFSKQISKIGAVHKSLSGVYFKCKEENDSTSCKVPAELLVKISSLLFLLWDVKL